MPKVLQPISRVTNGNMASGITGGIVDGRYLTNISFQSIWSGAPSGSFSLQESLDYNPVTQVGNWLDNGAGIANATGASGSFTINLSNRGPKFYRLVYTASSGTGTLNVYAGGSGPR